MNADPITAIQILGFQLSGMENNLQITRIIFLMLSFPFKFFLNSSRSKGLHFMDNIKQEAGIRTRVTYLITVIVFILLWKLFSNAEKKKSKPYSSKSKKWCSTGTSSILYNIKWDWVWYKKYQSSFDTPRSARESRLFTLWYMRPAAWYIYVQELAMPGNVFCSLPSKMWKKNIFSQAPGGCKF